MNKARITRIARLVALRQQQRRLREVQHTAARRLLQQAEERHQDCSLRCAALDHEHDSTLLQEVSPLDLELLGQVRSLAAEELRTAQAEVSEATEEAEARHEDLLSAHRAHRSLEIFHDRAAVNFQRDQARAEQRELDDIAARAVVWRRASR